MGSDGLKQAGELRFDAALVARGLARSREIAKQHILSGEATINGQIVKKASQAVMPTDTIECYGKAPRYVSRGGLKLEKAIALGKYRLSGKYALDIGASTGGFTDCMLQHGVKKVYAVDVGHGQLDKTLVSDSRVVNIERTDIRDTKIIKKYILPFSCDFCTIDVSFISVKAIFDYANEFLKPNADIVCLIKPQFEAGRASIGKNGIVKSPKTHCRVLSELCDFFSSKGFGIAGLTHSPVKGGAGNIEYLALLKSGGNNKVFGFEDIVAKAHNALKGG